MLPVALPYLQPPTPSPALRSVARGVDLYQEVTPDDAPGGPQVVTILRIDPKAPGVRVEAALGQDHVWNHDANLGREAVSSLARRRKAIVAVNASFFPFAGNPIGLHIEGDDLITEPTLKRTSFIVQRDGRLGIGAFDFDGAVRIGEESRRVDGLNRRPGKGNELLVFTPRFGPKTLATPERVEVVLEGVDAPLRPGTVEGKVRAVAVGEATPLTRGTVVVSAGGAAAVWLKEKATVGATLRLDLDVVPIGDTQLDPAAIRHAVTGAPRIVTDGRRDIRLAAESMAPAFSTTRHPRTAAGITKDGALLLVTVDGRQKGLSRGMSLAELADRMIAEGAVEAVNLDGGGSTTCVVHGGIVNSPSEGKERPVADALLIFADEEPTEGEAPALRLIAPRRTVAVGQSIAFGLPVAIAPESAVWGTSGGVGFVDQRGVFRALRPGKGKVYVRAAGQSASADIEVTGSSPTTP